MSWVDALGWAGSVLLIYSLMPARVLRFRVLNLVASVVLVAFNALLGIWSMVAMNGVLALVNVWFNRALLTSRHDHVYEVLEVGSSDAYLVQRGDETVGVVLLRDTGGGVAQIVL